MENWIPTWNTVSTLSILVVISVCLSVWNKISVTTAACSIIQQSCPPQLGVFCFVKSWVCRLLVLIIYLTAFLYWITMIMITIGIFRLLHTRVYFHLSLMHIYAVLIPDVIWPLSAWSTSDPVASIIRNMTCLTILVVSVLQTCSKRPSFLSISCCFICSFRIDIYISNVLSGRWQWPAISIGMWKIKFSVSIVHI